jgi:phosphoglycolate phosphatase-like HAD superfamily hydrolase
MKLFIFDLDRTIVDLQINWTRVKEKIRQILKTNHSLTPLIPSIEEYVTNFELKKRIYRVIDNEEMKVVKKLEIDEDIVKLFEKLKKLGYKLALVTLQGYKPAIEALNRLNIHSYFDLVISRNEKKTREEQIKMALEIMNVQASQAIIVADKLMDMSIAKKLGCMSMAVTDKPNINGDFKVTSIKEILKIMEGN